MYRGLLNVDFTNQNNNQYDELKAALIQAGWTQVETSAFVIEDPNIARVWKGIEIAAKQSGAAGILSALTFHIQLAATNFQTTVPFAALANHGQALQNILAKPFP
jgi:hypothetical protein